MAEEFVATLEQSEINVTLVLERTVNSEGGTGTVGWDDVQDKPSTFPPSTHNHDERYYTETEIDAKLNKFARPFKPAINDYFLTTTALGTAYNATSPSSTASNSNGRGKLTPFYISEPTTIDALALYMNTGNDGAGAVLRMGIYDDNDGRPGNVVVDAGTATLNGAASMKTLTFTPIVLQPGFYWAVAGTYNLNTGGTNPAFATVTGTQAYGDSAPSAGNNMFTFATVVVNGALSASPTVTISRYLFATCFHIWIRRSA